MLWCSYIDTKDTQMIFILQVWHQHHATPNVIMSQIVSGWIRELSKSPIPSTLPKGASQPSANTLAHPPKENELRCIKNSRHV